MSDDLPILPPALESIESQSPQPQPQQLCHKNAVQNVMKELADSKEHIDRTVLPSSHNFNGRPCLNMKEFFKLMTEKHKKQQNLDALYSLVENDSDSIIGFVELNGLSFIDEWLETARKANDYWLSLCILQFLAHHNLHITYQSLQTAPIAKAVKQFINPLVSNQHSHKVLSPQSLPRLTDKIRALLPPHLNSSRANDNFATVIDRAVIHKIVYKDKDMATISYLQSQFASRIVNKWKKFVGDWKKHNNRPLYRCVRFADEKVKPLVTRTIFHLHDAPLLITQQRDKKRREKMSTTVKWYHPHRMHLESVLESDSKHNIERGRDSQEQTIQNERVMGELEEFPIGTENLKDPKSLCTSPVTVSPGSKPTVIPLESEQTSPSVELNKGRNIGAPGTMVPGMAAPPYMATRGQHGHGHGPMSYPTMPPPQAHMMAARGPPYTHPHPHPHPHPPHVPPYHAHPQPHPHPHPAGYAHPYPPPPHHPAYPPPPYPPPPHVNMRPQPHPHPHPHPQPHPPPPHPRVTHVPYPYQQPPPPGPGAVAGIMPQAVHSEGVLNGNMKNSHRRRDFNINRPAKRQKIHDNRDNNNNNNNNRIAYDDSHRRDHRKRHSKHRNKDRKHKNRRGRNGRRNNTNGMHYYNGSCIYSFCGNYFHENCDKYNKEVDENPSEYFFVYFMFMFLAICYYFFGHKFGSIL